MLKILRDNLKYLSWILWLVVLVFIAFVFVDFGGALGGGGGGARTAAATVGGEEISYADFQREYQRLEAQYRQAFGESFTPQLAEQMRLPLQALDRLVDQKVLLGEADRLGLTASDSEVRDSRRPPPPRAPTRGGHGQRRRATDRGAALHGGAHAEGALSFGAVATSSPCSTTTRR